MHRTRGFGIKVLHTPVSVDVNECLKNNGGCDSKRKCINTVGSRTCDNCPSGWTNDGAADCKGLRQGVLVLSVSVFVCAPGVAKFCDLMSSHTSMLLDVNECAKNNGGCDSKRKCNNMPGSRTCGNCPGGWTNSGATGCNGLSNIVAVQYYHGVDVL